MNNTFKANFAGTAIGSFPHNDVDSACSLILNTIPEVPCWPQFTAFGMLEEMRVQYTEGLPCFKIDQEKKTAHFDLSKDFSHDMEQFYEKFLAKDLDYFRISKEYSSGFPALLDRIEHSNMNSIRAIKGQIVGPITLAGITKDQNKIAVINNDTFFDTIVKTLTMKACWQLEQFKRFNIPHIIFVDEPYLASIGSAFANIDKNQVINSLNEIFDAIHEQNGLAGIHCCGNTDWAMLIDTTVDIVNFDAYGYMDEALLYWREIKSFLERGGILAWGLVPTTTEDIKTASIELLIKKLDSGINKLADKGIDRNLINQNALLTPSCGTGSLDKDDAEKAMVMLHDISTKLKERL